MRAVLFRLQGTYTNGDKDVLYVDATSGKFQPKTDGTNRIQVNTGTKIVIPAAGDKAVIKLTVNKNVGTDKDSILGNTLNITYRLILLPCMP